MSFEFDIDSAIGFRATLGELGEDVSEGKRYIARHADFGIAGTGIINSFRSGHSAASGAVESQLDHIHEYLTSTLSEFMGEVFAVYRSEEESVQSRLRALEGEFGAESGMMNERRDATDYSPDTGTTATGYVRETEPAESLKDVEAGSDSVYSRPEPGSVLEYFSVTYVIRSIITMCGFSDPFDWLGVKLAGDWDKFTEYSMALENLADCIDGVASNLRRHVDQLEESWTGNAYAACNVAIYDIANQLQQGTAEPLRELAGHYEEAAQIAIDAYHALEPSMGIIADAATGIGMFAAITKGVKKLVDDLGEAIDEVIGVTTEAEALAKTQNTKFIEIELVPLDRLTGPTGSDRADNLEILTEDGLPMVLEKYERQ
ncbi:hypothetical protein SAMN06265360_102124 [Haloechinothrix alba]|uniref:Uncharacterized protein n=1 Tax=Haloechinothrix alba TaxID=664784 RepID=A0A238VE72_9PSEU|nr:hypothetical protein [Haloechinothrix alba]SNR32511.1 hypothetical protein SAMN06265360_102124 [Haloechinothrix alba]